MSKVYTLGEILLRLQTDKNEPFLDKFEVMLAGAAFNVAMGMANLGDETAPVSVVPSNFIGQQILRATKANGADASKIVLADGNQGIYFLEKGYGKNQSSVSYNRAHSVYADDSELMESIEFGEKGDILHVTGISLLVSEGAYASVIKIVEKAKTKGMLISFDFNYRSKMASYEVAKPRYEKLLALADYIFATKRDFTAILKWGDKDSETEIFKKAFAKYSNLKQITHTTRSSEGTLSGLQTILYTREDNFSSDIQFFEMIERIGGGDSFVAGILDGIVNNYDSLTVAKRANAYAILKQSTWGDFSNINKEQLDDFINNFDSEVSR